MYNRYSPFLRYGFALLATAAALVLTLLLEPLRGRTPFPFFFAAVTLTSWYGGLGPGLLATGLSAFITNHFFFSNTDLFTIGLENIVRVGAFVLVAILISSMQDISRASEARFRILLESAPDPIIMINRDGHITLINAKTEKVFDYTREELYGRHIGTLVPVWIKGTGMDLMGRRKDGSEFPIDISSNSVKTKEGELIIIIIRDITERKNAEEIYIELAREQAARAEAEVSERRTANLNEEIREVNSVLKKKIQELDEFTHVVSHDLKEPLRGIEEFSGFLLKDYSHILDEKGNRYLNYLKESAVRMKDFIDDLLTLASLSKKGPDIQEVDLYQTLRQVQDELLFLIQQKGAEIRIQSLPPSVHCDPIQIAEVFKNLLSNAVKFNVSAHPFIEIGVREDGDFYLFSVKDNGIGIEPCYKEKIFNLFERLHTREKFPGTGAGLAICKKVVEGYGGRIWVESSPGKGSIFFFTIPKRSS